MPSHASSSAASVASSAHLPTHHHALANLNSLLAAVDINLSLPKLSLTPPSLLLAILEALLGARLDSPTPAVRASREQHDRLQVCEVLELGIRMAAAELEIEWEGVDLVRLEEGRKGEVGEVVGFLVLMAEKGGIRVGGDGRGHVTAGPSGRTWNTTGASLLSPDSSLVTPTPLPRSSTPTNRAGLRTPLAAARHPPDPFASARPPSLSLSRSALSAPGLTHQPLSRPSSAQSNTSTASRSLLRALSARPPSPPRLTPPRRSTLSLLSRADAHKPPPGLVLPPELTQRVGLISVAGLRRPVAVTEQIPDAADARRLGADRKGKGKARAKEEEEVRNGQIDRSLGRKDGAVEETPLIDSEATIVGRGTGRAPPTAHAACLRAAGTHPPHPHRHRHPPSSSAPSTSPPTPPQPLRRSRTEAHPRPDPTAPSKPRPPKPVGGAHLSPPRRHHRAHSQPQSGSPEHQPLRRSASNVVAAVRGRPAPRLRPAALASGYHSVVGESEVEAFEEAKRRAAVLAGGKTRSRGGGRFADDSGLVDGARRPDLVADGGFRLEMPAGWGWVAPDELAGEVRAMQPAGGVGEVAQAGRGAETETEDEYTRLLVGEKTRLLEQLRALKLQQLEAARSTD